MARKRLRKDLRNVIKQLDPDELEQLLVYGEQLAGVEQTSKGTGAAKSLTPNDNTPSYTAAVDGDEYNRRRQKASRSDHADDMTPR